MKFANASKLNRKSGVRRGERGVPVCLRLEARMAHAYRIERVVAEKEKGAAIFASEQDVVRTLGHFYGA
jgi:hypothetical protein